jgi:aminopeptidase N/puromycin-sensitive aminopeptidase
LSSTSTAPVKSTDGQNEDQNWTVPVCLKTSDKPICRVLTPEDSSIPLPMDVTLPMLYANAGGKGYYRTLYTPKQYSDIVTKAETALTPPERIGLLGDRWALVRSGQATVGGYLDLVLALKQDPNAAVLDLVHRQLEKVDSNIATDEDRAEFAAVVRHQFGPVFAALGSPVKGEPFDRQQLRGTLFEMLGAAQDPAVLAQAQQLTTRALAVENKKDKTLDATLSDSAVLVSASNGDAALYDKLLAVSRNSADPGEKTDALRTLGRFRDPALVTRTLDYLVSGEVRNQDSWIVLIALLRDRATRDQTWDYIQKNWNKVHAQLTVSSGAEVVRATGNFCTVRQRDEVIDFFATHTIEASQRTLAKAIDSINDCIQLRSSQEPDFHTWLQAQSK